jgi:hypothetical protein
MLGGNMPGRRSTPNRVVATMVLGLGVLSCQPAMPPSNEDMLREVYLFSMAAGADTASFATFMNEVRADTTSADSSWREVWRAGRIIMSSTLGRLGYGTGPFRWNYGVRERDALTRFQRDLDIPATGRLDSATISHLTRAGKALDVNDMTLPFFSVHKIGQWFVAEGTWKAITDTLAFPVNSVDIVCDAVRRECSIVAVDFISENLDQLSINRYDLVVTHSTDDLLIARDDGSDHNRITLTINVPAKEVTWTQVNLARPADALGPAREQREMTMRLVSGFDLTREGGELREVHDRIYKDKDRYIALLKKNLLFEEAKR